MVTLRKGSSGPYVELLQSTLKKIGFYNGKIDGIFGSLTETAVKIFQLNFRLSADGIVGNNTWNALSPYLSGFTNYTIRPGDTLYSLSAIYKTSINRIITANPGINPNNLTIGQIIKIPFGNIIPTNIRYTYPILLMNIEALKSIYPFLEVGNIGKSVLGNQIPYIKIGKGSKEIFYNSSFHANEWINSPLLMKFVERFSLAYVNNTNIYGYNAKQLYNNVSLYIVPMVNPDGVNLVTGEYSNGSFAYNKAFTISKNYPNISFPQDWKANINGVDLNLQFPAGWDEAKKIKYSQGFTSPAPRDYVGSGPLVAPEALAVYNFTLSHNFSLAIAYHTQGKEIYWQFQNYAPAKAENIGRQFANVSGYTLSVPAFNSSFAGYKDWFLQQYRKPAYTIESGIGTNPLPISQFDEIYNDNLGILVLGMVLE